MNLDELKQNGMIATGYKSVAYKSAIPASRLQDMPESEQVAFKGAVVVDNCLWAATVSSIPVYKANKVFSGNGREVGCWQPANRSFMWLDVTDNGLVQRKAVTLVSKVSEASQETKNKEAEKAKEKLKMAIDQELLNKLNAEQVTPMTGFDNGAGVTPAGSNADGKTIVDPAIAAIKQKLTGTIVSREDIICNNQKYGRLVGFVTRTDPALKISVKSKVKLDAQGNPIPAADADAAKVQEYQKNEKKLPASLSAKEFYLAATHTKPSTPPLGIVVSTPMGSEIAVTKIRSEGVMEVKEDTTAVTRIMSMDAGSIYLATNYGSVIKELETILGNRASNVVIRYVPVKKKDETGAEKTVLVAKLAIEKVMNGKIAVRSTLYTDGNFFPVKCYRTIAQQDMSDADKAVANLNIEAAMKSKRVEDLTQESQGMLTLKADGTGYESAWFNKGVAISTERYDDKTRTLTNVQIPVRVKTPKKDDPTQFTYKFDYAGLEDADGPMSKQQYAGFVKATGLSQDDFLGRVKGIAKSSRGGSKKKTGFTADEFLLSVTNPALTDQVVSLADIQLGIEGLK